MGMARHFFGSSVGKGKTGSTWLAHWLYLVSLAISNIERHGRDLQALSLGITREHRHCGEDGHDFNTQKTPFPQVSQEKVRKCEAGTTVTSPSCTLPPLTTSAI